MTYPLEMIDVTCVFGVGARKVTALNDVNLIVQPGELVAWCCQPKAPTGTTRCCAPLGPKTVFPGESPQPLLP